MYMEGAQTVGHSRFQHINISTSCPCEHCIQYEHSAYNHHSASGLLPASVRQTDHPSLEHRRDFQAPCVKDVGGRAFALDRVERSGHRSPQRRPVFTGLGLHNQSDNFSKVCPWELNPAQWSYPLEQEQRQYLPVREQCGCVVRDNTGAHLINTGIPHPLPHLQVRGQGYRHKRTVKYVSVEEEQCCGHISKNYHQESCSHYLDHLYMPNGHCGPRPVFFEGGEERESHQEQGRLKGGSEEYCTGCAGTHKGFFPTEVPQKHLNQSRQKGHCIPSSGIPSPESSRSTVNGNHWRQGSEVVKQKRRQNSVRDRIRQVVTDLEEVLGGLKQVHVEMKEVVEQIDRLTAAIGLSEEGPCIAQEASNDFHGSVHSGDLRLALVPNHKPALVRVSQYIDEEHIIFRTNSLSSVHTASVVKTSHFTPPNHTKDMTHQRPGANGHPPHLSPPRDNNHIGQTHFQTHSQTQGPKLIIGNSTSNSRTHKPPPYPQNGQCGNSPSSPSKPVRTSAYQGRGRQNASMV